MNASRPRQRRFAATIAALLVAACAATTPPGSPAGSAAASASSAPSLGLDPSPSTKPASPQPSAIGSDPGPSDTIDGTAGPGCGTGRAGLLAHRDEVPGVLHFGGATIEFATAFIALRNGTYSADDAIPAGLGLTPNEIAVKVAPGTHILLRGAGLVLASSLVRVVPWSTVTFDGGLGASAAAPADLPARVRSDGSVSVSAPMEAGDYMVQFFPRWQSPCLKGDGSAYSRIKVVAP